MENEDKKHSLLNAAIEISNEKQSANDLTEGKPQHSEENLPVASEPSYGGVSVPGEKNAGAIEKKSKKKKKPEKKLPRKKLPRLYKKKYTAKKLHKKLLKRLYVPEDKKFVENLFVEDKTTGKLIVPEQEFNTRDVARLKRLSKEIKSQRGVIKLLPLLAVIALCVVIGMAVFTLKNIVVRRVMVDGMQKVFNAKTDLDVADFKIFDASLKLSGLAQASSSDPMKNIFEIGNININFNLTQLLRGKAHIEDITISGIAWNTDRKTSGELPYVQKQKKEEKPGILAVKTQQLVSDVQQKLTETFAEYNPMNIVDNIQHNLQSPVVAREIGLAVHNKVQKWVAVPEEVRVVVKDFSASIQDVIAIDWSKVNDVSHLRNTLTTVNAAVVQGNNLKNEMTSIMQSIQEDANDVVIFSKKVVDAFEADRTLVETQVNKISELRTKGIEGIVGDMLSTVIYSLAGEYYPYVQQGVDYAMEFKTRSEALSVKKEYEKKKTIVSRADGRDIYWKKDIVPKFLLENLHTSGPNFEAYINNVSSDMDLWGRPATLDGSLSLLGHDNSIGLTVDTRKAATYLVDANYGGTNFPISVSFPAFGINSTSGVNAHFSADTKGAFSVGGIIDMREVKFQTQRFEPEIVYRLYEKALATLDEISVGFDLARSAEGELSLKLNTDADEKFLPKLLEMFKQEMLVIVNETKNRLIDEIEKYTGDISAKITEFTGIEIDVRNLNFDVNNMQAKLEDAQKKITARIATLTGNAVQNALDQSLPQEIKDSPLGGIIDKTIGGQTTEKVVNKGLNALFDAIRQSAQKKDETSNNE